jgi:hypothetical protein
MTEHLIEQAQRALTHQVETGGRVISSMFSISILYIFLSNYYLLNRSSKIKYKNLL